MNRPPRNSVQPEMFQWPLMGTKGEKFFITTSPVKIGMMLTISSGASVPTVRIVWTRAVRRMPRCWMFQTTSMMTAPMKNVALIRSVSPDFRKSRLTRVTAHVLILAVGAKKIESRYPAPRPEPMDSTGVQASQLHHSEIGAAGVM